MRITFYSKKRDCEIGAQLPLSLQDEEWELKIGGQRPNRIRSCSPRVG